MIKLGTKPSDSDTDIKPRVLVLASTYPRWPHDPEPGFVHSLCIELRDQYEIHVVTPHAQHSATTEKLDGIRITRFRYAPNAFETLVSNGGMLANLQRNPLKWLLVPFFIAFMVLATVRAIRTFKPQIVHCHWLIPQGLVLWLTSFFVRVPPSLVTSHGGDLYSLKGSLGTFVKRKVIGVATATTVVSTSMVRDVVQLGADKDSVYVAPMGVGFSPTSTATTTSERHDGRILFVGRLVEKKGLSHLLSSLRALCNKLPDTHLIIAGDGPERISLEHQTRKLGLENQVTFLGALPQHELPALYLSAALFCAPFVEASSGDIEGLGLVSIEAIMHRCPVLIGRVPAAKDVIPPDLQDQFMVDPHDHVCFAMKIELLLTRPPSQEIIESMKSFVSERYSWSEAARQYTQIFNKLIQA